MPLPPPPPCIMKSPFQASLFGQSEGKADAELLAVDALAAIDNAVDTAMRGKRADRRSARIRRRDGRPGGNERGFRDLDTVELQGRQIRRSELADCAWRSKRCECTESTNRQAFVQYLM